jgi:hypothetical protein
VQFFKRKLSMVKLVRKLQTGSIEQYKMKAVLAKKNSLSFKTGIKKYCSKL